MFIEFVSDKMLFQKRVVRTKLDIYMFIAITGSLPMVVN